MDRRVGGEAGKYVREKLSGGVSGMRSERGEKGGEKREMKRRVKRQAKGEEGYWMDQARREGGGETVNRLT